MRPITSSISDWKKTVFYYPLGVVHKAGEDDDAKNEEKHEEHQLLG